MTLPTSPLVTSVSLRKVKRLLKLLKLGSSRDVAPEKGSPSLRPPREDPGPHPRLGVRVGGGVLQARCLGNAWGVILCSTLRVAPVVEELSNWLSSPWWAASPGASGMGGCKEAAEAQAAQLHSDPFRPQRELHLGSSLHGLKGSSQSGGPTLFTSKEPQPARSLGQKEKCPAYAHLWKHFHSLSQVEK